MSIPIRDPDMAIVHIYKRPGAPLSIPIKDPDMAIVHLYKRPGDDCIIGNPVTKTSTTI